MSERTLHLEDVNLARVVFGERDRHLAFLEKALRVEILARGTDLTFKGKAGACQSAQHMIRALYGLASRGYPIGIRDVEQAARVLRKNPGQDLAAIFLESVVWSTRNQSIGPKTLIQKAYVEAIRRHDIVFGWGPAGTGKTYLAMAMAVAALNGKEVDRIILTRPAVEAGEKLGFLPGDLAEKVNPYLRPLYDALHDMMNFEKAQELVSTGVIEVAPLAFMRGRTLNHSFVILDEAQNTTREQMKMFLTRLGFDSKAVITGDITQVDLPEGKNSGLVHALGLLSKINGIAFVEFSDADVVRHPLVVQIVRAYETAQRNK
ncbi:MAG: PhoH family protein [Pseudomonadota bacterium]